ncbi:MAG: LacI family DNA-binding transcriptional regulator [Spirochaetia bacterium]
MKRKRISAADVARMAGVSRTTVSFVLNNTPGKSISEDTRQRVLEACRRLNYEPDENARRVAMVRNQTVGLYIRHSQYVYTDAFIVRTVEGMAQAVNRHRIQLVIQPISQQTRIGYSNLIDRDGLDGVILINTREDDPEIDDLIRSDVPVVSLDDLGDAPIDQVIVDNHGAAGAMVDYLLQLGHERIAMIAHAPTYYTASHLRVNGYHAAMSRAGISVPEGFLQIADFSEQSGYEAMKQLLSLRTEPTAVFAGNDVVAYGALFAIREAGLQIPGQISLVGFDDDYLSRYLNPPLTSMALPAAGMGSAAVERLVAHMSAGAPVTAQRMVLPANISVRASSAPPANPSADQPPQGLS